MSGTPHFQPSLIPQKIVLRSLMLLAYVMKLAEWLQTKQPKMYHRPPLLILANSVNTEDADLKRFFRELERAGKGEVADSVWQAAKNELLDELKLRPSPVFESDSVVSGGPGASPIIRAEDV